MRRSERFRWIKASSIFSESRLEFMNSNNSPDNGKMTTFYSRILQIVVFLCKVELLLINDFW